MEKIYIDTKNKIWVDSECTMIFFDNGNRDPITIGTDQPWRLFRHLFLNREIPIKNSDLYKVLNFKPSNDPKGNLHRIVTNLRERFCTDDKKGSLHITTINKTKEIEDQSLTIYSTEQILDWAGDVLSEGTYTMVLPPQSQDIVHDLSPFYWDAYATIGAQKNSGRHTTTTGQFDLQAKLGEVYQLPKLIPNQTDDKWGWQPNRPNHILLVAPNGYGKTAFLRSLLLSSVSDYNHMLTAAETTNYQRIQQYHSLPNKLLPLYLECQYINFDTLACDLKESTHSWIYQTLHERLLIRRAISEDTFFQSISSHLATSNVLLLIDGFDEIKEQERKLLRAALTRYQESVNFNPHLSIIVATRPLSTEEEFIGFNKWHIASIKQNESFLHDYVNAYAGSADKDTIISTITTNPYLSALVSTPTSLVWTIKTCLEHRPVYQTVEIIISEIMRRNNYIELRNKESVHKKIYAELAYQYLTQLSDSCGIQCTERDFFAWLEHTIDILAERGDRKILKLLESKTAEELEQLFFTQVALMELDEGRLYFSTPVYAYHLAARRILTLLNSIGIKRLLPDLDKIAYTFRYKVIVATVTIGEHYYESLFSDISYRADIEMTQLLADAFFDYLTSKLNEQSTCDAEKKEILTAIAEILTEKYGSNVFTGDGHNPNYKRSFEELLEKKL